MHFRQFDYRNEFGKSWEQILTQCIVGKLRILELVHSNAEKL